jgi:hypothetical protein
VGPTAKVGPTNGKWKEKVMILSRTKAKFRYDGDPREVKISASREEAYEYARLLLEAGAENGPMFMAFLEDSETSDSDVIKSRKEVEST